MSVPFHGRVPLGLVLSLGILLLASPAPGQDEPVLRVDGLFPGGARGTVTQAVSTFELVLTNKAADDRLARVVLFSNEQPDLQFGRTVRVPGRSSLKTSMTVGILGEKANTIEYLLYDLTDGKERLILPKTEERVRSRGIRTQKKSLYLTLLADEVQTDITPGILPRPEPYADEVFRLANLVRRLQSEPEVVPVLMTGPLPTLPEAYESVDQIILATRRPQQDATGLQAMRRWVERGGHLWVMLDAVDLEALQPLVGDALDAQVVDRVSLTHFTVEDTVRKNESVSQEHDMPVGFVRVLLPPQESARHTVGGWPVWFTRRVGLGKIVFSTLGVRAWYRPRRETDAPPPKEGNPALPVEHPFLPVLIEEFRPPNPEEAPYPIEAFRAPLMQNIGSSFVPRSTAALVFGGALVLILGGGVLLRRSRWPELSGWMGPVGALLAMGVFMILGHGVRQAAPATVVMAQMVEGVPGAEEVPVRGLLGVYRPDSGPAEMGATKGGLFDLDMAGLAGQKRRFLTTDRDAWHWDSLSLPAGLRWAPFRTTIPTTTPLRAIGRFGPQGLEGRFLAGSFTGVSDALIHPSLGRDLAIRLQEDGSFQVNSDDALPPGQFLTGTVLSDQQKARQELYRVLLAPPKIVRPDPRIFFLGWADPLDLGFTLAPGARTSGSAFLRTPIELDRTPPGTRVTIPGAFVLPRRTDSATGLRVFHRVGEESDMRVRFQIPEVTRPLTIEKAQLMTRLDAPGRRVRLFALGNGEANRELIRVENPLGPIRVDFGEPQLLTPDPAGGLHFRLTIEGRGDPWQLEYLELELVGRTADASSAP